MFIVLAAYCTSWDMIMRDISETGIYWLFIDWKSAVALKTPICPHVWFSPHCSLLTITWNSQWPGLMTWNTSHLYFFIASFFLIHNKLQYIHWRKDRLHPWRNCVLHHASRKTWFFVHMAFNVCQCLYNSLSVFCKGEPLLFFWDTD